VSLAGVVVVTLGILLGQFGEKFCSELQIQHLLFVSYVFTVEGVLFVAISLTIRCVATLGCGTLATLGCGMLATL